MANIHDPLWVIEIWLKNREGARATKSQMARSFQDMDPKERQRILEALIRRQRVKMKMVPGKGAKQVTMFEHIEAD